MSEKRSRLDLEIEAAMKKVDDANYRADQATKVKRAAEARLVEAEKDHTYWVKILLMKTRAKIVLDHKGDTDDS